MQYEAIMQKVSSGLTGNPEADMKYLQKQMHKYKTHELAQEILRGIGRMIYEVIPSDKRNEMDRLFNNHQLGVDVAIEEAEFQIHKNNFKRALEILESIIKKNEDETGKLIMFRDDKVSEYHYFRNTFEEILYKEMFKPERTIRPLPENFGHLYFIYGTLLFELKRFDEASIALKKAIHINPINIEAMFELAEISKVKGDWENYLEQSEKCLPIAYSGSNLGRCFRNIGFYYIEKQKYDVATVLYYISMHFDQQSNMAQSELLYIQQISGKPTPPPSNDEIQKIFKQYNIQPGASELVLGIAAGLGRLAKEQGQYDAARFFLSILYNLTYDDDVKDWIEELPETE